MQTPPDPPQNKERPFLPGLKARGILARFGEIGIHPTTSKMLWKYVHKYRVLYGIDSDHVFIGQRGPLKIAGVEYIISVIKRKCGIDHIRVTTHVLRHTFSKMYLKRGGDLFKLSRELGHSTVQITGNIYLGDFKSADAREDHDRYSPVSDIKIRKNGGKKKELK